MSQFEVFLVEDNMDHALLASDCLRTGRSNIEVCHFPDGPSLLNALDTRAETSTAMPHLLLLDLNMPGMDGFQILEMLKTNEIMRLIPVVVVSTSKMTKDIRRALYLNANSYSLKSMDFDIWERTLLAIRDYWYDIDQSVRMRDHAREIQ